MNAEKTGNLIRSLRIKKGLTQKELAQMICVTDKAVCKWEKGRGCPNITLISQLSKVLEVDIQSILQGYLDKNKKIGENMNHLKFYKCPTCGNLVTSIKSVELSCCGNKLSPVSAQTRSDPEYQPVIQEFDGQYSIKFNHPMTKSNYISQVIVVRYDQIMTVNLYAESEAIITIPQVRGIRLFVITNKSELIAVTV
ncbi:MAG: helix-turn-helix domain-containing protein [Treponema sp.]|nr:helix-turn-helix domain-containing protein [Spirochaetales bacterium]MDY5918602.1 helix-turn-helix domain-containing protein [Treponema sp.]MDY6191221.1 helix-turn-helix domain-containing protein [Treponema sp.]